MNARLMIRLGAFAALGAAVLLAGCERPPMKSEQKGFRGTGMVQIDNPRLLAKAAAARPEVPANPPAAPQAGPLAKDVYQNVKVLGDLPVTEFLRTMTANTLWVAPPAEGCNYCHVGENFADDSKYTKVVARRMFEMTRNVNSQWGKHIGQTGVTCYTCHRGQPVPQYVWFKAAEPKNNWIGSGMGDDAGQNRAVPSIAWTSMAYDPFSPYLQANPEPVRVQSTTALPTGNRTSIKQTEFSYSLMMHMSQGLGVNCTFCHNSQAFASWDGPTQRVTAWHGLRMAAQLNADYLTPLTGVFPPHRLGPTGDVAKLNCQTCHQGQNKPLGGMQMAKDFPALLPPPPAASAAIAAQPEAAPAAPQAQAQPAKVAALAVAGAIER